MKDFKQKALAGIFSHKDYLAPLRKDVYKVFHKFAYKPGITHVYSNFTNRFNTHSNVPDNAHVMNVGLQYVMIDTLIQSWGTFFEMTPSAAVGEYSRVVNSILGKEIPVDHLEDLHALGYLPISIKSLPEGVLVPYGVPSYTIVNTVQGYGWLVNMLETVMSAETWGISTSATTAYAYRKRFEAEPSLNTEGIKFMGHDFSYRGAFGTQAAAMSGFGHLTSFYGSDTIPAGLFAERYYGADFDTELVMASVDATEHSVMCSYENSGEKEALSHLMTNVTPTGILSVVSDTWDFWQLVTEYLPELKDLIMRRDGTVVIRPDSGDPVDILTGNPLSNIEWEVKGLIECLYDIFDGTAEGSLKLLDSHIGAIYGDSITLDRQDRIITRLVAKGFVPSVVLGIGSFTYQYVTRDTHGSAVKATDVQFGTGNHVAISKDPKTDQSKKSARGLLRVDLVDGEYTLVSDVTPEQEAGGELKEVFRDGKLLNPTTLEEIRHLIDATFN